METTDLNTINNHSHSLYHTDIDEVTAKGLTLDLAKMRQNREKMRKESSDSRDGGKKGYKLDLDRQAIKEPSFSDERRRFGYIKVGDSQLRITYLHEGEPHALDPKTWESIQKTILEHFTTMRDKNDPGIEFDSGVFHFNNPDVTLNHKWEYRTSAEDKVSRFSEVPGSCKTLMDTLGSAHKYPIVPCDRSELKPKILKADKAWRAAHALTGGIKETIDRDAALLIWLKNHPNNPMVHRKILENPELASSESTLADIIKKSKFDGKDPFVILMSYSIPPVAGKDPIPDPYCAVLIDPNLNIIHYLDPANPEISPDLDTGVNLPQFKDKPVLLNLLKLKEELNKPSPKWHIQGVEKTSNIDGFDPYLHPINILIDKLDRLLKGPNDKLPFKIPEPKRILQFAQEIYPPYQSH